MRVIALFFLLLVTIGLFFLWWKLFQLGNKRKRQTLEVLNKKLELSVRENGVKGSIFNKKLPVVIFYAVLIIVLVFGLGAVLNRLLGN